MDVDHIIKGDNGRVGFVVGDTYQFYSSDANKLGKLDFAGYAYGILGGYLAVQGKASLDLIELGSGAVANRFPGEVVLAANRMARFMVIGHSAKVGFAGRRYQPTEVIDWSNGLSVLPLPGKQEGFRDVRISGNFVVGLTEAGQMRAWDRSAHSLASCPVEGTSMQFEVRPGSSEVMLAGATAFTRMDLQTGKVIDSYAMPQVLSLVMNPPLRQIVCAYTDGRVATWNYDGSLEREFKAHQAITGIVSLGAGGRQILTTGDNAFCLWNLEGKLLRKGTLPTYQVRSACFLPDGKRFVLLSTLTTGDHADYATCNTSSKLFLYDAATFAGKELVGPPKFQEFLSRSATLRPYVHRDGRILIEHYDRIELARSGISVWDGKGSLVYSGSDSDQTTHSLSQKISADHHDARQQDGPFSVEDRPDGSMEFRNAKTGNAFSMLSNGKNWITFSADGYFDASRGGGELVKVVTPAGAAPIDQFAPDRNRPDLLLKRLGVGLPDQIGLYEKLHQNRIARLGLAQGPEALAPAAAVPTCAIQAVDQQGAKATVKFLFRGPGAKIASYNLYLNNVPIVLEPRKAAVEPNKVYEETLDLSEGRNKLEVSCVDAFGTESVRAEKFLTCERKGGELYYLGFGVSNYQDPSLKLLYAAKDAADLGEALRRPSPGSFSKVHIQTFVDQQVTPASIAAAKQLLQGATVDDTVVVFIAGHGVHANDELATYYFLTHGADVKNLQGTAVPFEALEDLLYGIRPLRKLFLMDTCESGERDNLAQAATAAGPGSPFQARAIRGLKVAGTGQGGATPRSYLLQKNRYIFNNLARRSGAIVFSSCRGDEFSYEPNTFQKTGNGFFTGEVLRALKRPAADGPATIGFRELEETVQKQVAVRSKGLQNPTVDRDNLYMDLALPLCGN